jgi:nucleotide-binding universal stress UspA family protein
MKRTILVPLDGASASEAALPVAEIVAKALGADLFLLHVMEERPPELVHGERHLGTVEDARAYLAETADRLSGSGLSVEFHVHEVGTADLAKSIVLHAGERSFDLVVMSAHGRGGLRRMVLGSMAQRLIADGSCPVLLVNPNGKPWPGLKRVLVALDQNPAHEAPPGIFEEFAAGAKPAIRLLTVVDTYATLPDRRGAVSALLPGTTQAVLDLIEVEAREGIELRAKSWRARGCPVSVEIRRGHPATSTMKAARSFDADLIVLFTHGSAGTQAFWRGSVTARIVSKSRVPVLLVPVGRH